MMLAPQRVTVAGEEMIVRDMTTEDAGALLALHERVFGSPVGVDWYDWKYGAGGSEGVGVWHGDELVAHCAGVPRTYLRKGREEEDLQIGDVMVTPRWRGVLTRRGPFFLACRALYTSRLGPQARYALGFGFPNERHLRLAVKSGLSWDAGALNELNWDVFTPPSLGALWRAHRISPSDPGFDTQVDAVWSAMQADALNLTLGDRSAGYLRWRFEQKPGSGNHFLALSRPWSKAPLGIAVLGATTPGQPLHWLDWVGPLGALAPASRMCRREASRLGASSMVTWASRAVEVALASSGISGRAQVAGVGVPIASDIKESDVGGINWWFMSGDTDFL